MLGCMCPGQISDGIQLGSLIRLQAMVSMVMAEVQNMANMDQDLFRSRFVNVICRIQGLLLQSRESAASQEHQLQVQQASDGPASDAASDGQSSSVERGHRAVDDFLALEPDEVGVAKHYWIGMFIFVQSRGCRLTVSPPQNALLCTPAS